MTGLMPSARHSSHRFTSTAEEESHKQRRVLRSAAVEQNISCMKCTELCCAFNIAFCKVIKTHMTCRHEMFKPV